MMIQNTDNHMDSISDIMPQSQWVEEATYHATAMDDLLYPKALRTTTSKNGNSNGEIKFKARTHAVPTHPIYNFLHSYYRYSPQELRLYSPGLGRGLSFNSDDSSNSDSNDNNIFQKEMDMNATNSSSSSIDTKLVILPGVHSAGASVGRVSSSLSIYTVYCL
jgi:hypothetical protein